MIKLNVVCRCGPCVQTYGVADNECDSLSFGFADNFSGCGAAVGRQQPEPAHSRDHPFLPPARDLPPTGTGMGGASDHWGATSPRLLPESFQIATHLKQLHGADKLPANISIQDFGITWQKQLPGGGDAVSWNVELTIHLELVEDRC